MYEAPKTPLSIAGVLDNGFALFRAALPGTFLIGFVAALVIAPFNTVVSEEIIRSGRPGGFALVAWLLTVVVQLVAWGAVVTRIDGVARGQPVALGAALRIGWRRGPALFGMSVLASIAIGIGFLLLLVPGCYLMIVFLFGPVCAIVERKGPIASLKASAALVRGHWWRSAGVVTVAAIIGLVVYFVLVLIGAVVGATNPGAVLTTGRMPWYVQYVATPLVTGIVMPLYALVMALYYDLKLRREGLDISERIAAAEA
jgi:hypothetical protein